MQEAVVNTSAVEYPTSDGKPVAETDLHFDRITYAAQSLKIRYANAPDVYVGANMLVYDEPGNPADTWPPTYSWCSACRTTVVTYSRYGKRRRPPSCWKSRRRARGRRT